MIDFARIRVIAGDGGKGSGSFTHIPGKRYGKADGGNGGWGGHVYLEASASLATLETFRYVKEYRAKNGANGASRRRKGAQGADLVIRLPVGTVVRIESRDQSSSRAQAEGSQETREKLLVSGHRRSIALATERDWSLATTFDLTENGQKTLVARGGEGGRGNCHLRDEFGRRPNVGESGREGETVNLQLELKLIADVGLIGLPNSGKSTLLAALTSAHPKIAPYPFTTLEPNLGVLASSQLTVDSSQTKEGTTVNDEPLTKNRPARLVMADIPGLIEGASQGKGLGDLFLRHIERTRIIVHLIDASTLSDKWQDYQTIRNELKVYSKELIKKKEIIVLTKRDLVDEATVGKIHRQFAAKRKKTLIISAVTGEGLSQLCQVLFKTFGILKSFQNTKDKVPEYQR